MVLHHVTWVNVFVKSFGVVCVTLFVFICMPKRYKSECLSVLKLLCIGNIFILHISGYPDWTVKSFHRPQVLAREKRLVTNSNQ